MAIPIIPRFISGRVFFQVATAWSAADAHRLGVAEGENNMQTTNIWWLVRREVSNA